MKGCYHFHSVVALVVAMAMQAPQPAMAQFDIPTSRCRDAILHSGNSLSRTALKAVTRCHKARDRNASLSATDCNDLDSGDPKGLVPAAAARFSSYVQNRCDGIDPATALHGTCPSPCDGEVPNISSFSDVADCLVCLDRARVEALGTAAFGTPVPPLGGTESLCHRTVMLSSARYLQSIIRTVSRCQARAERAGNGATSGCTDTDFLALVQPGYDEAASMIAQGHCSRATLPGVTLDPCGAADSAAALGTCVADATRSAGQSIVLDLLGFPGTPTTTTTTTSSTTTTLPAGDPVCPDAADIVFYSRDTNQACSSNSDCSAPRTCDVALGKCTSVSEFDQGWTGLGHDADGNDGMRIRTHLYCPGTGGPTCGECDVLGISPEARTCRCSNDSRTVCSTPFANSPGCGTCECFVGTPTPVSSSGTPMCILEKLAQNISGTTDVDLGASAVAMELRTGVFLGEAVAGPCPTCGGACSNDLSRLCDRDSDCNSGGVCNLDASPNDGLRGGFCRGGQTPGQSCDVMARNASFPASPSGPGGGGYSLDCMPGAGRNVSGSGLRVSFTRSTGASQLESNLSCGGANPGLDCPCLQCSGELAEPCRSDAECASQQGRCSSASSVRCSGDGDCASLDVGPCRPFGPSMRCADALSRVCTANADCMGVNGGTCDPSTCSSPGVGGNDPLPNDCDGLLCSDLGGGAGQCTNGPDDLMCDGVTKANGDGVFACSNDSDCLPGVIGVAGGSCTLSKRRSCVPSTLAVSGSADPNYPVSAAPYCIPPTANAGLNAVLGLPGPGRLIGQEALTSYCASNPSQAYVPGVGGCP